MIVTGTIEMAARKFVGAAALCQLAMMLAFVTLLHRAFPEVFFADGVIALVLASLFVSNGAAAA